MNALVRRLLAFGDPSAPVPVLPLLAAVLLLILLGRTVHDSDIFWQLKLGELTLAHGLPDREPFLAGREADRLPAIAWLGQVVFAGVRQLGGWPLLRAFDAVVWLSGFIMVARQAGKHAGNDLPATVALWAGWFSAVTFASVRPQTFAVAAFGLVVVLVRSRRPLWQTLPLTLVVLVVGQNLHPAASVVGTIYLATVAFAHAAMWLARSRPRDELRPLLARILFVPLAALTTFATPQGTQVIADGAVNRERSIYLGITEWLPIWELELPMGRLYTLPVMAGVLLLVLVRGRRARTTDLLPLAVLTVMTCLTFRFVLFWGVAVIPVIVSCLWPDETRNTTSHPARRWVGGIAFLLAAAVPVVVRPNHFADYLPFAPLEKLKAEGVEGTIYCHIFAGGIITDLGHPKWKPSHDGRYYMFTREQLDRHHAVRRGEVPLAEVEAEFRPVALLFRPGDDDGVIEKLKASDRWRLLFADDTAAVYVRK